MGFIDERRGASRERIAGRASIVFNGRQSIFDCAVRNWSQTGALVRLSDWTALPASFEIDFPKRAASLRVRQCWRRGDDVGVAFLSEDEMASATVISLERFRKDR